VGKLQRYFWPKTLLLFYANKETIEAAFGFFDKKSIVIETRRAFDGKKKEHEIEEWYEEILQTYPKTYVGTMLDSINQGAISGCSKQDLEKFDIKSSLVHTICVEEKWLAYASLVEMKWFEKRYVSLPLDFIFSPFIMLYEKVKSDLTNTPILAVLHQKGVLYIAVFSNEGLWFSQILAIAEDSLNDDVLEDDEDDDIGLAFDLENLDTDIEDTGGEAGLDLLDYDLNFFDKLKISIENFYHSDLYKHEFLESILIYDADSQIGRDIVRYIQDELFMNCSLHDFDPIESMSKLAFLDLKENKKRD